MAITNTEIVNAYKFEHNIPLELPLQTYAVWKKQGYHVKKGEVCKHKIELWKHNNKTITREDGTETEKSYCFQKTMYLFEPSQVEKIKG